MGIRWNLVIPRLQCWGWHLLTKVVLGIIYIAIIADGLRYLFPAFGMKLWKIPGFGELKNYEGTYKLDIAPFLALFLMIAVFTFWHLLVRMWLRREWERTEDENPYGWNGENHSILILSVGGLTLAADLIIFYIAVVQTGWAGAVFSFTALIATVAYLGVLLYVSYVSVCLHERYSKLENAQ